MRKKVVLSVPRYLKKYLLNSEFGQVIDGTLHVGGRSLVGSYIASITRPVLFPLPKPEITGSKLVIYYTNRDRTVEVPPEKLASLVKSLDEQFRRSLICEVRALHELCGGDYSRFIRAFLNRYNIEADVDIEFDTVRKIYRDFLERIDKTNRAVTTYS
ncbi:hypothetical protein [Spirosoma sp. 48-14]|uniref:hypothetical protein n=1 Tax=Spirosoma sp. 48-14 TaxID=1895854 RepID=UPI0009684AE8|nr:hypothetical protein [Spirosoma sp. 48-14]OJW76346.1 MAG: hypothetical protein BGO59_22770 [Spirosoma sp. 48-14]